MNRTRAPAFHSAEKHLAPGRRVAVVGHISRTWHKDEGVLAELFEYLAELGIDVAVVGQSPFRLCAARSFLLGGLPCDVWDEMDPEAAAFLSCSDLIVALGPRAGEGQRLCTTVIPPSVPVLVLWANDHATFIAARSAAASSS